MNDCNAVVFAQQNTELVDMDVLSMSPMFQQCLAEIPEGNAPDFDNDPKGASLYLLSKFVGSKEEQCEPFFEYWNNRDLFNRYIGEDQRPEMVLNGYDSVDFCSEVDGDMAGLLAKGKYSDGKWNDAHDLAEAACDLLHYPSCGLQAYLIEFKSLKATSGLDDLAKKKKAKRIAQRGYELSDGEDYISALALYDVMRSGLFGSQNKESDKLLAKLLSQDIPGAKLRKAEQCFKKFSILSDCSKECSLVDRLIRDGRLDYISQDKALKYQKHSKCD